MQVIRQLMSPAMPWDGYLERTDGRIRYPVAVSPARHTPQSYCFVSFMLIPRNNNTSHNPSIKECVNR
jgi:hypothetical protein